MKARCERCGRVIENRVFTTCSCCEALSELFDNQQMRESFEEFESESEYYYESIYNYS